MDVSRVSYDQQMASPRQQLPNLNEHRDYIVITQEILDVFKEHAVKSNTVDLKLNPVRFKSGKAESRRYAPSVIAGRRSGWMFPKSHTSLDFRDQFRRPVKVFVEDITKICNMTNTNTTSSSVLEGKDMFPRKQVLTKSKSKSSEMLSKRSLESGDDAGELPEDIIETVARANTAQVHNATVLPEIRAAQCPIHVKKDPKKIGADEAHYWLQGNAKDNAVHNKHRQKHPLKNISIQQNTASQNYVHARGNRMDINVRIPEQFPTPRAPVLPKNMSSKDYVMSWLIHGSDPQETNHFPEIVPGTTKPKSKPVGTRRRSHISE